MAYEDLLKSVEESAQEREQELRKKTAVAIEGIRERATKQAGEIRQAKIAEAVRSVTTERNKMLYLEKAKNKEALIKAREAVFETAFHTAEERLKDLRNDPKYKVVFEHLLREATGTVGEEACVVHVDPRDEGLCKSLLSSLSLNGEVRADLRTAGGIIISQHDGTVLISNTIESRLQRAREHNRHTVHAILTGG
jgi:V/A-type H+-transporting ATPase subunit E